MQRRIRVERRARQMGSKILISTTVAWTTTARHAAGFALAGCEVEAVAPAGAPVTLSRYASACYAYRAFAPLASLRDAIRHAKPDLIVSCDDRAVESLLRLYRSRQSNAALDAIIKRSLGTPEQYADILSRERSMRGARALGIRVPDTLAVPDEQALEAALDRIGLPAVLKADGSWGGEGVAVVTTPDQSRAAFRRLANAPSRARCLARWARRRDAHWIMAAVAPQFRSVVIQKFIPGAPAASAFAAWNGELVATVSYDVLRADGTIGPPTVIQRRDCPEIAEATRLIARRFQLSGLHGIDFIRDENGHVHLIEINPRATQGGTLAFGPGRDLAAGLASCIDSGAKARPAIENDRVVFFPREWLRDPASAWLDDAHHDVPWDDPPIMAVSLQDMPVSYGKGKSLSSPTRRNVMPIPVLARS